MAAPRSDGGPEITFMKCTSPSVPTTASMTTLPVSKSLKSSRDTTARTDLINLGGTITLCTAEGKMGCAVGLGVGRTMVAFTARVAGDVFLAVGCSTKPLDAAD